MQLLNFNVILVLKNRLRSHLILLFFSIFWSFTPGSKYPLTSALLVSSKQWEEHHCCTSISDLSVMSKINFAACATTTPFTGTISYVCSS